MEFQRLQMKMSSFKKLQKGQKLVWDMMTNQKFKKNQNLATQPV